MKHFITTIFLAHYLIAVCAQNNVIIELPDAQVNAGDEITYPITINPNGNSVGAFKFEIEYDSTLLRVLNVELASGWGGGVNPNTPGIIIIAVFNAQGETATFQAIDITFEAIGQVGKTDIELKVVTLIDVQLQPLNHQVSNGNILINSCIDNNNPCEADLTVNCGNVSVSGNTMSVSNLIVSNSGEYEASHSFIAYYLSSDADITKPDFYLGYDYISTIEQGATSNKNTTIDLSNLNIPAGTYYLGILADFTGRVGESDETNNICYIEVSL